MWFSSFPRVINPHTDDEAAIRTLVIRVQGLILLAVIGVGFVIESNKIVAFSLAAILIVSFVLTLRGIVSPGQILTPIATGAVSVIFMINGNGIHDIAIIGLAGSIVVAGLFLGARGTTTATGIVIAIILAIGGAEVTGLFKAHPVLQPYAEELVVSGILFLAIGLSLQTTLNRLKNVAAKARENEYQQIVANRDLLELKKTLEARVDERTFDLEKRAAQLETISKVARSISSIQDLERLLPAVTMVVSEQFGFYHAGIFLLDERAEFAVLEAANSEGGQRMLKRGHRLRLGATGIVGYVAAQGEPRIALDVGADAVYFNNPDLPNTRSEVALPLKAGNNIIGVLDVQSTETNAFKTEDVDVLNILANQIAIAIENARLFSQTRKALAESQSIYDEYIKREWSRFGRRVGTIGFAYDGIRTVPISNTAASDEPGTTTIPVKIRGMIVGSLQIRSNNQSRQWSQDELNLVRGAAERAGLAIENVRLLDEAQRRAAKERTIGEISSRIAASIDMNDIMQTAVEELGRALPGSEIVLQFESGTERAQQDK